MALEDLFPPLRKAFLIAVWRIEIRLIVVLAQGRRPVPKNALSACVNQSTINRQLRNQGDAA
jgi:hypothetical protein